MKQGEVLRKQIQYYSYVIGAIIFLVLGKLIGDNGLAYMAMGIEVTAFCLTIAGEGITDSFCKLLRQRRKRNQYQDVRAVKRRVSFIYIILGLICSLLVFIFSDTIAIDILKANRVFLILRIMSPLILLRILQGLILGYFQSFSVHLPAVVTCILRQVLFFILANVICTNRMEYGNKVAAILKNDDYIGMYGAVGLAIALTITELILTVLLLIFFVLQDKSADNRKNERGIHKTESLGYTLRNLTLLHMPNVILSVLKRLFILIPFFLCLRLDTAGWFYGKLMVLFSIPILLFCARYVLMHSRLISIIRNRDMRMVRDYIQTGIQYTWGVGLFLATLTAVLAPQFVQTYFPNDIQLITYLQKGAVLLIIIPLLIFLCIIHIAFKRKRECIVLLMITLVLHIFVNITMFHKAPEASTILNASIISLSIGVILSGVVTIFQCGLKLEYIPVFVLPLICVAVMGVIVLLITKYMTPHIGNQISLMIGTILGIVIYIASLGMCRVFSEVEVERIYGKMGRMLFSFIFK